MFYGMKCNICGSPVKKDNLNCPVCGNRINDARNIKNNDDFSDSYDPAYTSYYDTFEDDSDNVDLNDKLLNDDNHDKKEEHQEAPITFKTWILAFFLGLTVLGSIIAGIIHLVKGNMKRSEIYFNSLSWSWFLGAVIIFLCMSIMTLLYG
ncbi:MAG TPA: hypothetical protein PKM32_01415 [Planctomycetota bacterium]|nr:hypothetical protein [Planctomycetota bacterium]